MKEFRAHPYQQRAIDWVLNHRRCCLFMEMGLGKTVVTLSAISLLHTAGEVMRVLVIAPRKVAESTWHTEAAQWRHLSGLRVEPMTGTPRQRREVLCGDAHVCVMSRDSVVWLLKETNGAFPFDMVVIDELTSFKNSQTQRFKALKAGTARTPRVVGLTGTPTPNSLKDLWGQMYCIDRGERLGKYVTHFLRRWFHVVEHNHIPIKIYPREGAEQEILNAIKDICLTMRTEDYLQLPALMETDVPVLLPEKVMQRYKELERELVLDLKNESVGDRRIVAAGAAALLGKLTQFAGGAIYDEQGEAVTIHGEKIERLAELVESTDGPVLCFYHYKHEAERIEIALKGVKVERYRDARQLQAWNAGDIDVLLAHPSSTAFGLNMQHGGHVAVWYGPTWNLEEYEQANARLHRQGQTRPVMVYRLVAAGTVDERIAAALDDKARGQEAVMKALGELI